MARVPRVAKSERPSGVTQGVPLSPELATVPIRAVAGIAGTVAKVAASESRREKVLQNKLAGIQKEKQVRLDKSESALHVQDYELSITKTFEAVIKANSDDPQSAGPALLEALREQGKEAVALGVNDNARSLIRSGVDAAIKRTMVQAENWKDARISQKIRANAATQINQIATFASTAPSYDDAVSLMESTEKGVREMVSQDIDSDTDKQINEMKEKGLRMWLRAQERINPIVARTILQDKSREHWKFMTGAEIAAQDARYVRATNGLGEEARMQKLQESAQFAPKIFAAARKGELGPVEVMLLQESLKKEKEDINNPLNKQFTLEQRAQQTAIVEMKEQFLKNIDRTRSGAFDSTSPEKLIIKTSLLAEEEKLFNEPPESTTIGISEWLRHVNKITQAWANKSISESDHNSMMRTAAPFLEAAAVNEADNTAVWNNWRGYNTTRRYINSELKRQFSTEAAQNLSPAMQLKIRFRAANMQNDIADKGQVLSVDEANKLARQAIAVETGRKVSGIR